MDRRWVVMGNSCCQQLAKHREISCTRVRFIKLHAIATASVDGWMGGWITGQSVFS